MKEAELLWAPIRGIIGSVIGLDGDGTRHQVEPLSPFSSIEDDVEYQDLLEMKFRAETALMIDGIQVPRLEQTVSSWISVDVRACLMHHDISISEAISRLRKYNREMGILDPFVID